MLDDQRVARPAAGRDEEHRLADKRQGIEQVEEVLEQTAVASLVDGASQDESVGGDEGIDACSGTGV